jgi:hypothetical protein
MKHETYIQETGHAGRQPGTGWEMMTGWSNTSIAGTRCMQQMKRRAGSGLLTGWLAHGCPTHHIYGAGWLVVILLIMSDWLLITAALALSPA